MSNIPNDPIMLMSYMNTQLRDNFSSLDDLISSLGLDEDDVKEKLLSVGYSYDDIKNQFVRG